MVDYGAGGVMTQLRGPNYISMATLARKLDYGSSDAAAKWARERGIPFFARSQKTLTVREADVDAAMEGRTFDRGAR